MTETTNKRIFVCGPLYGNKAKFKSLLENIKFSENDRMIILGDVISFGTDGFELFETLSQSDNIYLLLGKGEYYAKNLLPKLKKADALPDAIRELSDADKVAFAELVQNGGYEFANRFFSILCRIDENKSADESRDKVEGILDFLDDIETHLIVKTEDRSFYLGHSIPMGFNPKGRYFDREFTLSTVDYKKVYNSKIPIVTAEISTAEIEGGKLGASFKTKTGHINIDSLGKNAEGKLCAFCLNTRRYFYSE